MAFKFESGTELTHQVQQGYKEVSNSAETAGARNKSIIEWKKNLELKQVLM